MAHAEAFTFFKTPFSTNFSISFSTNGINLKGIFLDRKKIGRAFSLIERRACILFIFDEFESKPCLLL